MRSGSRIYTVAPDTRGFSVTLNERVVFSSSSKAQVVSLARHAALANAPSAVVVRTAEGEIEQEWAFAYEQQATQPPLRASA